MAGGGHTDTTLRATKRAERFRRGRKAPGSADHRETRVRGLDDWFDEGDGSKGPGKSVSHGGGIRSLGASRRIYLRARIDRFDTRRSRASHCPRRAGGRVVRLSSQVLFGRYEIFLSERFVLERRRSYPKPSARSVSPSRL